MLTVFFIIWKVLAVHVVCWGVLVEVIVDTLCCFNLTLGSPVFLLTPLFFGGFETGSYYIASLKHTL